MFSNIEKQTSAQDQKPFHKLHMRSLLTIVFAGVAATLVTGLYSPKIEKQTLKLHVQVLNQKLVAKADRYNLETNLAAKNKLLTEVKTIAAERQSAMTQLIHQDPKLASATALPDVVRQNLPAQIKSSVEHQVALVGNLTIMHSHDLNTGTATNKYYLKTQDDTKTVLNFTGSPPPLEKANKRVKVSGLELNGQIAMAPGSMVPADAFFSVASTIPSSSIAGPKKVAVILMKQTNSSARYTVDQVRNSIFTGSDSVAAYYNTVSYGKQKIIGNVRPDGDIFGYYSYTPAGGGSCPIEGWQKTSRDAIRASGVDLTVYNNIIDLIDIPGCSIGAGDVGGPNTIFSSLSIAGIVHEMGHNYGAQHANSLLCYNGEHIQSNRVPISLSCDSVEYGDPYDVMGPINKLQHFNNFHKAQFGFLDDNNIVTASSSGSYTVTPLETTGGIKAVRVPIQYVFPGLNNYVVVPGQKYYYLEYRQPDKYDTSTSNASLFHGVSIRLGPEPNIAVQSNLIDTSPNSSTYSSDADYQNSSLALNKTFTDAQNNLKITTTGISSSSATVNITFGGLTPPTDTEPPSVPQNFTGYLVNPQVVFLSWTGSTDNFGVTKYDIYRNGQKINTIDANSSRMAYTDQGLQNQGLPPGTYQYYIKALDAAGNVSAATPTITLVAGGGQPADTTPPTTPTGLSGQALDTSRISLSWLDSSDNVAVTGYDVYRNGTKITTVSLTNFTDTNLQPGTTYQYYVKAKDLAGNTSVASMTIGVTTKTQAGDSTPPSTPTNLSASAASSAQVNLSWFASTDNVAVTGYNVLRNGVRIASTTSTSFADGTVNASSSYTYTVTAYDAAGNTSQPSNEVPVTTPANQVQGSSVLGVVYSYRTGVGRGPALAGASVSLYKKISTYAYSTAAIQSVVSDSAGNYLLTGLDGGDYKMVTTAVGYNSNSQAFTLAANSVRNGTIILVAK